MLQPHDDDPRQGLAPCWPGYRPGASLSRPTRNWKMSPAPGSHRASSLLQGVAFTSSLAGRWQTRRIHRCQRWWCSRRESHPHFSLRRAVSCLLDDANLQTANGSSAWTRTMTKRVTTVCAPLTLQRNEKWPLGFESHQPFRLFRPALISLSYPAWVKWWAGSDSHRDLTG